MFAKLYGPDDDQVLVTFQESDDGPEVRFCCQPEGLGVCSFAVQYEDTESGWDKAEHYFGMVNEDEARRAQRKVIENLAFGGQLVEKRNGHRPPL